MIPGACRLWMKAFRVGSPQLTLAVSALGLCVAMVSLARAHRARMSRSAPPGSPSPEYPRGRGRAWTESDALIAIVEDAEVPADLELRNGRWSMKGGSMKGGPQGRFRTIEGDRGRA